MGYPLPRADPKFSRVKMHAATGFGEDLEPRKRGGKVQGEVVEGGEKFKGMPKSRFQLQMHFGQEIVLQVELDPSSLEQGGKSSRGSCGGGGKVQGGGNLDSALGTLWI